MEQVLRKKKKYENVCRKSLLNPSKVKSLSVFRLQTEGIVLGIRNIRALITIINQ